MLVVEEERKQYPCKQVVTESFICKGWLKTLTTLSFVMLPLDKDVHLHISLYSKSRCDYVPLCEA